MNTFIESYLPIVKTTFTLLLTFMIVLNVDVISGIEDILDFYLSTKTYFNYLKIQH